MCACDPRASCRATAASYLADTLGELGNWYALSNAIFLGGSLKPVGGHNPFEVALSGSGVISGPEVFNFSETYAEMSQAGVVRFVKDDAELATAVDAVLNDTGLMEATGRAARDYVRGEIIADQNYRDTPDPCT